MSLRIYCQSVVKAPFLGEESLRTVGTCYTGFRRVTPDESARGCGLPTGAAAQAHVADAVPLTLLTGYRLRPWGKSLECEESSPEMYMQK